MPKASINGVELGSILESKIIGVLMDVVVLLLEH